MNSKLYSRAFWLLFGLSVLPSCASSNKRAGTADAGGTGGANAQGTGGSTASDASNSVTLVAVPNDQDGPPVAKPAGLAPTPPMGWNSWNSYSSSVTADLIKTVADIMVSSGMQAAGYQYVNIDDGWALTPRRSADGGPAAIEPDPVKFPPGADGRNGIKVVADYVHSKGLKLGIYSDRGAATCGSFTASGGYELLDARAYAESGVDYLKYDNCFVENSPPMQTGYKAMRDALNTAIEESGHDIVFSMCSWAFNEWNLQTGQLWRTTGDIAASFSDPTSIPTTSNTILRVMSLNKAYAAYAGPNNWNDADMLEVGNLGTSALASTESHTHFALWAMMASPLIAGNRLDNMSSDTLATLTNPKVIAVDQDYLGLQGVPVKTSDVTVVWAKPLNKAGARAVLFINADKIAQNVSVNLTEIGLSAGNATVYDLWPANDPGQSIQDSFSASVPSHGSVMVEIDGNEPGIPQGTAYLTDLTWTYAANGSGPVEKDMSSGSTAAGKVKTLSLRGTTYKRGLGVAAGSKILYRLAKRCSNFSAVVGVDDDSASTGSVGMQVFADGEKLFDSGTLTGTDPAKSVNVDLSGKQKLTLFVNGAGNLDSTDHADWADAKITCSP